MALKGPNSGVASPSDQSASPLDYGHGGRLDTMGPITIAFWAKYGNRSQVISNGHDSGVMAKSDNAFPGSGWTIYTFVDTGVTYIELDGQGWNAATQGMFAAFPSMTDNNWHHCCFTYTWLATDIARFWIDGVEESATFSGLPDGSPTINPSDTHNVRVGDYYYNTRGWQGSLDDIGIWNVVLTLPEIQALAAGTPPARIRPDALIFAPLMDNDAAHAVDLSVSQLGAPSVTGAWSTEAPPVVGRRAQSLLREWFERAISAGGATLSGAGKTLMSLTGKTFGTGAMSGAAQTRFNLTGKTIGTGALSGAARTLVALTGKTIGIFSLSGAGRTLMSLTGKSFGTGVMSGAGRTLATLTGKTIGTGVMSGAARSLMTLTGKASTTAFLNGAATTWSMLFGKAFGTGALSGAGKTQLTLQAKAQGSLGFLIGSARTQLTVQGKALGTSSATPVGGTGWRSDPTGTSGYHE